MVAKGPDKEREEDFRLFSLYGRVEGNRGVERDESRGRRGTVALIYEGRPFPFFFFLKGVDAHTHKRLY